MDNKTLDIVVPIFNESQALPEFINRIKEVAEIYFLNFGTKLRLIFVNDGSQDNSRDVLESICQQNINFEVEVVELVKNFGSQAAISAGIAASTADFIAVIPVDLQEPPELILDMISYLKDGTEVVFGARSARQDTFINRFTSKIYGYLFMPKSREGVRVPTGSFLAFDKHVRLHLVEISHLNQPIYEKILWLQSKYVIISYNREMRQFGESKWTTHKRFKAGLNMLLKKNQFLRNFGLFIILSELMITFCLVAFISYSALVGIARDGWLSIITIILFFFSTQSLLLLILIEYAAKNQLDSYPWFMVKKNAR